MSITATERRTGWATWFALTSGIGAWAFHITALAALVETACAHRWVLWLMHGITVVTATITLVGMAVAFRLRQAGGTREAEGGRPGRLRFMGDLSLLIGAISLALIAMEGMFVPFLNPCG